MLTQIILGCAVAAVAAYAVSRTALGQRSTGALAGAGPETRAAARRLEYKPAANSHPVASIHMSELCVAAMATAFAQMDERGPAPSGVLAASLEKRFSTDAPKAADLEEVGQWIVAQSDGPTPAFQELTKRLKQLDHGPEFEKLMRVLGDVTAAGTKGMPSPAQADALGALARIFRTA